MTGPVRQPHAVGLVLLSSVSLQLGLAVAATTFDTAGPISAVWIRSTVGAAALWLVIRPDVSSYTRGRLAPIAAYGASLAAMTLCVYVAVDHAPLGYVSAVLMLGPLTVAALGSRTPLDLVFVGLAAVGALLLTLSRGASGSWDPVGMVFAGLAAAAFAAYIVVGKAVNSTGDLSGLALALVVTALLQTPLGVAFAHPGLTQPTVLLTLVVAGVLATLIPFTLEALALRTLSAAVFGLVLAFEPAIAALVGVLLRGDALTPQECMGILLIVVAAAGSLGPRRWTHSMGDNDRGGLADSRAAALATVSLLDGLSTEQFVTLATHAQERELAVGEDLTVEGDTGDDFFLILEGRVDIRTGDRLVRTMGPGEYLGELAILFGGVRTATATASAHTRVVVLSRESFLRLLADHPETEDRILATVSERMRYR